MPFQRTIRAVAVLIAVPTAQAFLAETAATPKGSPPPGGVGLSTRLQAVPFHCTIRVLQPDVAYQG